MFCRGGHWVEQLYEVLSDILYSHCLRTATGFTLLRDTLVTALAKFPNNLFLLGTLASIEVTNKQKIIFNNYLWSKHVSLKINLKWWLFLEWLFIQLKFIKFSLNILYFDSKYCKIGSMYNVFTVTNPEWLMLTNVNSKLALLKIYSILTNKKKVYNWTLWNWLARQEFHDNSCKRNGIINTL